jgi:hypothetical protein
LSEIEHVKYLITEADNLLKKKDFVSVMAGIVLRSNHGHSGWTEGVSNIFYSPQNDEEKVLSQELEYIMLRTAIGLYEQSKPTKNLLKYMNIEAIVVCLTRLGAKAPPALVRKTRILVERCKSMGMKEGNLIIPAEDQLAKM